MVKHDFEKLLLEAVDEGLSSLGDSSKQAIYIHLDRNFDIKKKQIPDKIEAFEDAIESIFGLGASFLEVIIMKQLCKKVGGVLEWKEPANLAFTMYVAAAERTFQQKKTIKKTEDLVRCEEAKIEV